LTVGSRLARSLESAACLLARSRGLPSGFEAVFVRLKQLLADGSRDFSLGTFSFVEFLKEHAKPSVYILHVSHRFD
jgi:hypothetical protein